MSFKKKCEIFKVLSKGGMKNTYSTLASSYLTCLNYLNYLNRQHNVRSLNIDTAVISTEFL